MAAKIHDGSFYIGLEDGFIGDGEADTTTRPLSTYKENLIDGNTRWLTKNRTRMTFNVNSNLRRFGGANRWYPFYTETLMLPCDRKVRIYMNGGVINSGGGGSPSARVGAEIAIVRQNGEVIRSEEAEWTNYNVTNSFFVEMTIPSDFIVEPEYVRVCLGTRCLKVSEGTNPPMGSQGVTWESTSLASIQKPSLAELPDIAIERGAYCVFSSDAGDLVLDILGNSQVIKGNPASTTDILMMAYNTDYPLGGAGPYSASDFQALFPIADFCWPSVILPKSFLLEIDSDPSLESPTLGYQPKTTFSMRAQEVVTGTDAIRQASNVDHVFRRARIVAQGPTKGLPYTDAGVANKIAYYQDGHKETLLTGGSAALHDIIPFRIDYETSIIRIRMKVAAFYNLLNQGTFPPGHDPVSYRDVPFKIKLPITCTIAQLDSTNDDWFSALSSPVEEVTKDLFINTQTMRPLLFNRYVQQTHLRKYGISQCDAIPANIDAAYASYNEDTASLSSKEGHIAFDIDGNGFIENDDLEFCEDVVFEFDVDLSTTGRDCDFPYVAAIQTRRATMEQRYLPDTELWNRRAFSDGDTLIGIPLITVETIARES